MDKSKKFILWFDEIGITDVPLVGGKNASLGEMIQELGKKGVEVPNGFAVTAYAYRHLIEKAGIEDDIREILADLDTHDMHNLKERGRKIRKLVREAELPGELTKAIKDAYEKMHIKLGYEKNPDVAVRSSATAEDLPDASFAGQQETYLNVKGSDALMESCKKCFASLFTDRAISYREDKGFSHFDVYLSIGVQKMIRADSASSGVMFSIDTESGFKDAVFITGAYGLGENVVQGNVNPDEFYVFKPTLREGKKPIIGKKLGGKKIKMIYSPEGTKNVSTTSKERNNFCISDEEALKLAEYASVIEDHYSEQAGKFKPMDIEWAKDGDGKTVGTGKLFIVQARPETVHSQKDISVMKTYVLKEKGKVLVEGQAVGELIGQGEVNVIHNAEEIHQFKKGQVLVTDMTDPDWEPIMKIAAAIVTNRGGRTCFTGDTLILTNKGFMKFKEVFENHEGLYVPSLNRKTLKVEWKKIIAAMKRKSRDVVEVDVSQTGRMKGNNLRLTKDHKILTIQDRKLISKEIQDVLSDGDMLTLIQKIPGLHQSSEEDKKLAYLLGAISTDGHIYLSRTHGEVQFIQKPTTEKESFISTVQSCMKNVFDKTFRVMEKKPSQGIIRGKPVYDSANAYRCYSKQIAIKMLEHQQNIVQTLLQADDELILNYLAGVIDGDGSFSQQSNRISIYCSNENLLQSIVVGCLRLGVVPQVSTNRSIYNVQIVEQVEDILKYTKRVKGAVNRKSMGTRFFSARQLLGDVRNDVNYKGQVNLCVKKNLLWDIEKIRKNVLPICTKEVKKELLKLIDSDLRMLRVRPVGDLGEEEVYNITVEDNHNYVVFTDRLTPVLVNNCHTAIVSRELGIPCVIGTENGTQNLKNKQKVTVSCSEGEVGKVYQGLLKFEIKKINLKELPETRTKIMMNVGIPEKAFVEGQIPCDGVGLAREEFIINSYIGIHPLALIHYDELKKKAQSDKNIKKIVREIDEKTLGYQNKVDFFVDELARGIGKIGAGFYPNPVIVRFSDFKTNEYANLIGGQLYEPEESNPMIGWRGASRYYDKNFKPAFELECKAILKARNEFGLINIKVMIPFCRTVEEGKKVIKTMEEFGLKQGENSLEVYMMCEIPSNVILADQFAELFDGFSIGSNDLTQLALGLDRDSELVSKIYDERNEAVRRLISEVIKIAHEKRTKIGICGQAPSDYEDFAEFLVECGIDSISLNPDTVIKTKLKIAEKEKELGITPS